MIYTLLLQQRKVCLMLLFCMQLSFTVYGQSQISGKVISADDQMPVIGAIVKIKGSVSAIGTGLDGTFSIPAKSADILVVSYMGYKTLEITIGNQTNIVVILTPAISTLDEVVVTGYSAQRKKDIAGSVAIVDMKGLKSVPSGSAMQALQGQASGVNVISSGVPGAASKILIRGVTSFGNTQPLVLIDGVQADLNNVSADDVESIQVLKDAGAAAIYGVRGSNGVIVVTTKKGKSGVPTISYDSYYGIQQPKSGEPLNQLNSQDFARLTKEVFPFSALFANGMPDFLYAGPKGVGIGKSGDTAVDPRNIF